MVAVSLCAPWGGASWADTPELLRAPHVPSTLRPLRLGSEPFLLSLLLLGEAAGVRRGLLWEERGLGRQQLTKITRADSQEDLSVTAGSAGSCTGRVTVSKGLDSSKSIHFNK